MRAFLVTWRAIRSYYEDLFLLVGMSGLWWIVGGFFVGGAVVLGWPVLQVGGPWWLMPLAPLLAIPAGPATAALANVVRRAAREQHVDRSYFWEGLRTYWRRALALSAISMTVLSLLLLNLLFYLAQPNALLRATVVLWLYLVVAWLSAQIYLYPVLIGLEQPTVLDALRISIMLVFANPFFSIVLVVLAIALTALSVGLAILLLLAWPALMLLMGEHASKLMVERIGGPKKEPE